MGCGCQINLRCVGIFILVASFFTPIVSAASWKDIGSDGVGDQSSGKAYLDLSHFYSAIENGCILLKVGCSAEIPTDTVGEHKSIAYEVHIDSRDGGDTYYNGQWGTAYGWDYNVELDYSYGSPSAWLMEYKGNQWIHAGEISFEISGSEIILKIPLNLVEITNSETHFQFDTIDNDGSRWWFADVSDSSSTLSAADMPVAGYLGLVTVCILGLVAMSAPHMIRRKSLIRQQNFEKN